MDRHQVPEGCDLEAGGVFPLPPWLIRLERRRVLRHFIDYVALLVFRTLIEEHWLFFFGDISI